ncbi:structural protein [Ambidensovirus CaaDV1]|uniref:Structural protein n=1 Tax=Crassostrea ariakensis ambidensovirus 1 TaxID=2849716 RepID=A0A1W5YP65_9VIRU|nr:structural protein [Ambidensovirus CaaDV1]ARI46484.1 structural protein [Crassostrea ariakensis ambidensovirus 1]
MNKKDLFWRQIFIMSEDWFVRVREGLRFRGKNVLSARNISRVGARLTRLDNNLWLHGSQEELNQILIDPVYESLDDVIQFQQSTTADVIEEVELNDLDEINLSEEAPLLEETSFSATPALAEAGGVLGTSAAASGPGTGAVVTGVAIGAGIITVGTTVGVLSNRNSDSSESSSTHKDPIVSIPDHRFIGPGNTVDDTPPVDVDDDIALEHDIRYENAQSQQDIQDADRDAANDFLTDAIHNNNPHSVVGYIGLKGKEKIESIIGVQYPPNLPVHSSAGMSVYRTSESYDNIHHVTRRALPKFPVNSDPRRSPSWRKRNSFSSAEAWKNWAKYTWGQWNVARQNRGLRRVEPPSRMGIAVTQRPRTGQPNNAMSFNDFRNSPEFEVRDFNDYEDEDLIEIDDTNIPRQPSIAEALSNSARRQQELNAAGLGHRVHNDQDLNDLIESGVLDNIDSVVPMDTDGGSNSSSSDSDNRGGAGSSNQVESPTMASSGQASKRQRTDAGSTSTASASSTDAGASMSAGADGGFDSTTGPDDSLFKGGYNVKSGSMSFSKVHTLTIEALPYTRFASNVIGLGSNSVCTPLARIDWDYPYFYMSEEEFNLIPAGSYFKDCNIDIMGITYPTGYPTGGTTADVSQTNHAKILMAGFDLEKKNRFGHDVLVKTVDNNMVPTSFDTDTSTQVTDFIVRQYGTDQTAQDTAFVAAGCATDIPYRLRKYWSIYQPNRAQALSRGFFTEDAEGNITADFAPGQEIFRNYINQVNANNFVWDKDVMKALVGSPSLKYQFKAAPIGQQFKHLEIYTGNVQNMIGSAEAYHMVRTVTNVAVNGDITNTETIVPSKRSTLPLCTYKTRIEQGATMVKGDYSREPARQPTFHIGLKAIEKFDPTDSATRASKFVHARMTIQIKATINVTLPSYPNRFLRPKEYTTQLEMAVAGTGHYQSEVNSFVTYNDLNTSITAPTLSHVDTPDKNGVTLRSLPKTSVLRKSKRNANKPSRDNNKPK